MKTIYIIKNLFFVLILFSKVGLSQEWEIFYGEPNQTEYGKDVIETYDKGYLLIASKESNTIQAIKIDVNGEVLWQKSYNNNDKYMYIQKVIETSDNGYVMVGYSKFYNNVYGDPLIIKFNSCFEKEWCKTIYKQNNSGNAMDVIENNDNILLVLTNGNNDNLEDNMNIYGITLNGEILWERDYAMQENYPELSEHTLYDLIQIGDNYFASGFCYYPYPGYPGVVYLKPFIVGIDENYDEKWILPYGINDTLIGEVWRINYQNEDTIYSYGYKIYYEDNQALSKGLLIKFNAEGEELGIIEIENDSAFSEGNEGNIINLKFLDNGKLLGTDILLDESPNGLFYSEIVFDTLSNVYNVRPHENYSNLKRLITTYNKKYLQCGNYRYQNGDYDALLYKFDENLEPDSVYTASYTYDSLCPNTIESEDLELEGCIETGIGELPTPKEYYSYIASIPIKIYPNPASNVLHFALENTQYHSDIKLQIFDTYGKLIEEQPIAAGSEKATTDVGFWKSGMYAVMVLSGGKVVGRGKFVVR